jgi:hypothetical protein
MMVERETGIEPVASSLGSWRSTAELLPLRLRQSIIALEFRISPATVTNLPQKIFIHSLRKAPFTFFMFALSLCATATVAQTVNVQDMSRSTKPGDDFYRYANGNWLATVVLPDNQSSYDTRAMLADKTSQRVRDLIQNAASSHSAKGSIQQKIGDCYASFIDEAGIEAKGITPLAAEIAKISAISDEASLSSYLGGTLNTETDGLTANADHIFGVWVNQSFTDSENCVSFVARRSGNAGSRLVSRCVT